VILTVFIHEISEKNWFETQQNEAMDVLGGEDSNRGVDSPIQSCPAGPDGIDKQCQMCHDQFEHFYNEETEEWHLKSAIMVDDVFYHPLCYEDYKASLTLDESAISANLTSTTANNDDDDVEIVGEGVKKEKSEMTDPTAAVTSIDDEDDDVIALPTEEPVVTEILDDEEEPAVEEKTGDEVAEPEKSVDEVAEAEDKPTEEAEVQPDTDPDVMIKEPIIETHDVDEYVPKSLSNSDLDSSTYQPGAIKIKEEPKDDGYEDDGFEDVGTFEASFVMEHKDSGETALILT
jgi:pre-mRNA cleavage complex 2 protein Pcf11